MMKKIESLREVMNLLDSFSIEKILVPNLNIKRTSSNFRGYAVHTYTFIIIYYIYYNLKGYAAEKSIIHQ